MTRSIGHIARVALVAGLLAACCAAPAVAMEWSRNVSILTKTITYTATGTVVRNDAEKLKALITASDEARRAPVTGFPSISNPDARERYVATENRPVVQFNSEGGDVVGGLRLGSLIREQGFDTTVAADAECHSACTMAFLGGVSRTVSGLFGIHAMSPSRTSPPAGGVNAPKLVDSLQTLSSLFILYTRDMVGSSDMADAALQFGSQGIALVTDAQLRDWGVITIAKRPTQRFENARLTTIDCRDYTGLGTVKGIVCNDLTLARDDIRIAKAIAALRSRVDGKVLENEQARWATYRDGCESKARAPSAGVGSNFTSVLGRLVGKDGTVIDPAEFGRQLVETCVREAYQLRTRELEALAVYHDVRNGSIAAQGWHAPAK